MSAQQAPQAHPRMPDPDEQILAGIESLAPSGVIDHTPLGRLAGLDQDTYLTYRALWQLLTDPGGFGPAEWSARVGDLTEALTALHSQTMQAHEAMLAAPNWW